MLRTAESEICWLIQSLAQGWILLLPRPFPGAGYPRTLGLCVGLRWWGFIMLGLSKNTALLWLSYCSCLLPTSVFISKFKENPSINTQAEKQPIVLVWGIYKKVLGKQLQLKRYLCAVYLNFYTVPITCLYQYHISSLSWISTVIA